MPLGPFIVDFLAPEARLVVEVDGGYHELRVTPMRVHAVVEGQAYRVLRVSASGVAA